MKKSTLVLTLAVLLPMVSATAYEYNSSQNYYYSTRPTTKTNTYKRTNTTRRMTSFDRYKSGSHKYATKETSYSNRQTNANYQYGASRYVNNETSQPNKQTNVKTTRVTQERKFFLAHPFFQPLKGKVGSVTDLSFAKNNFSFDIMNGSVYGLNALKQVQEGPVEGVFSPALTGKAETSQFAVKEDLSYGLTDTLAVVLMGQYDSTKSQFKDWSVPSDSGDSKKESGLNVFGVGLQYRFADSNEWIGMTEAFFEHQKDSINTLILGVKGGYKVNRTLFYGLGRVAYTNLSKGDTYGVYVDDANGDYLMLSYNTKVENILQVEGGIGAFSVLNKYFTLNGEVMLGHYDWHNQMTFKAAFGWQPKDMFALNLYASAVIYDSAKGMTRQYMMYDANPTNPTDYPKDQSGNPLLTGNPSLYTTGDYKINNYNEWKIGVQAVLYF